VITEIEEQEDSNDPSRSDMPSQCYTSPLALYLILFSTRQSHGHRYSSFGLYHCRPGISPLFRIPYSSERRYGRLV
jgi:hypothetical protein